MGKFKDISGERFGKWLVTGPWESRRGASGKPSIHWQCRCDCGTVRMVRGCLLRDGGSTGCGVGLCIATAGEDMPGGRVGQLLVLGQAKPAERRHQGGVQWECVCDCGNRTIVVAGNLQRTASCGCTQDKGLRAHSDEKRIPESVVSQAVTGYRNGENLRELANQHGVTAAGLYVHLRNAGVRIKTASEAARKYRLNEKAFDVETPECHYWTGFLLADGCVSQRKGGIYCVCLSLQARDKGHVETFRQFLVTDHPIDVRMQNRGFGRDRSVMARISISSTSLAESLIRRGVVPRKSTREKMPQSLCGSTDAWRGFVDGDGWVCRIPYFTKRRGNVMLPEIGICGSKTICEQFAEFTSTLVLHRARVTPNGPIWRFRLSGRTAIPVIKALYENASVALDRKLTTARIILADGWR